MKIIVIFSSHLFRQDSISKIKGVEERKKKRQKTKEIILYAIKLDKAFPSENVKSHFW